MYDIIIIGAGVSAAATARELSRYEGKFLVLEKENDVANGTTKANTALVHAGYDATEGSNMAHFNVKGNAMFDEICEDLYVPFERTGSLVVGFTDEDRETIEELYQRGINNGVPNMEIIERDKIKELVPNISDEAKFALYAKTGGIVGPWELATNMMENAVDNGVEIKLNTEVKSLEKLDDHYIVKTTNGDFKSKLVINAAGLYADKINNMVSEDKFEIQPVKGQYYLLDKQANDRTDMVIFQCPSKTSKGIVVSPTVHGNIIVGPDSVPGDDKDNKSTSRDNLSYVKETAKRSIKDIPFNKNITNFAGLRANPSTGDFIIGEAKDAKGFINIAGIKSPGLTAAPAIGEYIANLAVELLGGLNKNDSFNPRIRKPIRFIELTDDEKNEVIKKDKRYGNIICRCETVTEGEIVDAINRNVGATSVDAVKRRVRAGMGRCQGGFCMPKVVEILARELGQDMTEVVKDGKNSEILTEKTK